MMTTAFLLASAIAAAAPTTAPADSSAEHYTQTIKQWHAERIARLKQPDGWLSLVGLDWLKSGANSIGSAADNDIVLKVGPEHLGTVTLADDGKVTIALDAAGAATIDGKHLKQATLLDDSHEQPTTVAIGSTEFYLIEREGRHGLRIKNPQAATRTGFKGIDSYAIDPSWRIVAKWVPFDPMHHVKVATRIGTVADFPVPGKAVFERDGKTFEILPVIEVPGDTELFVMFADRTSGKTTYGAGRFLYTAMPKDGKIVLDFNKAYNPPCAFTPYATCPLPPPENRLDLAVTAGERAYHRAGE